MSLRVLLADESSSIKKAFELALQDYQVKVQTVHQGVDVAEIYQSFQPDICFMDIMLPKLNGYDACKALKEADSATAATPVVLMWSGFMELDAEKFKASGAQDSIEKPFETKTLRALIQKLVPTLNQNEISNHLIFEDDDEVTDPGFSPDSPSEAHKFTDSNDLPPLGSSLFEESSDAEVTDPGVLEDSVVPPLKSEEIDIAATSELPEIDTSFLSEMEPVSENSEDWSEESLNLAPEGLEDVDAFSVASLDDSSSDLPFESVQGPEGLDLPPVPAPDFGLTDQVEASTEEPAVKASEEPLPPIEAGQEHHVEEVPPEPLKSEEELIVSNNTEIPQLSKDELKRLILAQSKDIIESVVWDVVPELAKEMIQKEINRLTGEVQIESDLR